MSELQVIMPRGALGESADDDWLESFLRDIAVKYDEDPKANWASKYGANYEDDVFMMHRYCWCGRRDCPWCEGCECPDSADHYFVDGKEVTFGDWVKFYYDNVGKLPHRNLTEEERLERDRRAEAVDKRRAYRHDVEAKCDFCKGTGVAAQHGGEPGRAAPNFWYRPSDIKVWWYKYIGREMETNRRLTRDEALEMARRLLGD